MTSLGTTITDALVDPEKMLFDGVDTSKGPHYSISELAKFFFARSTHWVRWVEKENKMYLDEVRVGNRRNDKDVRIYYLEDVELIAHALAQQSAINGNQLRSCLTLLKIQATMNGIL